MSNEHPFLEITECELTDDLVAQGGYWAILDATDTPLVPSLLEYERVNIRCLYKGEAEKKFAHIAPYLVELDANMLRWLKQHLWEEPWGIAFKSKADMESLHHHFRKFIMVRDEAGTLMYFRFYDPRVLPTFLKSCTQTELEGFFGPVNHFVCKQEIMCLFLYFRFSNEEQVVLPHDQETQMFRRC